MKEKKEYYNDELEKSKEEKLREILEDVNLAPDFTLDAMNDSTYTLILIKCIKFSFAY